MVDEWKEFARAFANSRERGRVRGYHEPARAVSHNWLGMRRPRSGCCDGRVPDCQPEGKLVLKSTHLLFAAAFILLPVTGLAAQTPATPSSTKPEIRVLNTGTDSIRIEFRSGRNPSCDQKRSVGTRMIGPAKVWTVRSDGDLCYRYQKDPNQRSPTWSAWVQPLLTRSAVRTDSI